MRLNEITYNNAVPVDGYGPGFFRIGGQVYNGAVLSGPTGTADWGGYTDDAPLLALSEAVDVLFIGTGEALTHIPSDLRTALEDAGMGVEIMNSPAACRTYNVLLSEGRRVALALLPV
ncbi:Mth938-like domain-containing protein [Ruegeria arenilitoris]|uniref:Mth938-like domain-containing protein n=1 Tax=Ruegeria arenilitoris TaxID=1173585 RepID=UPI00147DBC25|nr:Mth938-like domain-containing protein [Ruegeria arenilitoris]